MVRVQDPRIRYSPPVLARLSGIVESVDPAGAIIAPVAPGTPLPGYSGPPGSAGPPDPPGPLAYEVMLPAASLDALASRVGQHVSLRTFQYFEQQAQGASFIPRLVGFLSESDERLFELLTKVKGLGVKRALRAMAAPTHQIASAIADADIGYLKGLPEIGKKLAETIVLELKDKVGSLAFDAAATGIIEGRPGGPRPGAGTGGPASASTGAASPAAQQAIAALVRLGEDRDQAESRVRAFLKEAGTGAANMTPDEILAGSFSVRL